MKKPKRREAVFTMREIAEALDHTSWAYAINIPLIVRDIRRALRRIAARKRKKA